MGIGNKGVRSMAEAEGGDVVLERPLVLEVGAADTEPELAAVLLVGSPVSPHGEGLLAVAAREGLGSVLALVVSLQCSEVLQRPRPRMRYVVPTPFCAAVAWHPNPPPPPPL